MRDENFLLSCLDVRDRLSSFKFFENILYLLTSFSSFVVSGSFFDLLADVSHLGLFFSVHICLFSMRAKNSWSLLSIVSSLCTAIVAVCCCSASPIISSLRAAVLVVCCCSRISASSSAAASCLLVNLFSSSSYLRYFLDFSDGSGSSRVSIDADCLVYLVFLQRFCFRSLLSNSPSFPNAWESKMRSNRSVVTPQVNHGVCLGVGTVSSASFVNYHVVQLFMFPARRSEGVLFFGGEVGRRKWHVCVGAPPRPSRRGFPGSFLTKTVLVEDQSLWPGLAQEYFSEEFLSHRLSCAERVPQRWRKPVRRTPCLGRTPTPLLYHELLDAIKPHAGTGRDDIPGTILQLLTK